MKRMLPITTHVPQEANSEAACRTRGRSDKNARRLQTGLPPSTVATTEATPLSPYRARPPTNSTILRPVLVPDAYEIRKLPFRELSRP